MEAVPIGRGLYRAIVRSKAKRERLALIPEVQIEGFRVIFPEWMLGNIRLLVEPRSRSKSAEPAQSDLFE